MSIIDFERKFRSAGLIHSDEEPLRHKILSENNTDKLSSLLYIYGRSFFRQIQIENVCIENVRKPTPGLTAGCLRVLIEWWSLFPKYESMIEKYLDMDLYDNWYDEVIWSVSFVSKARANDFKSSTLKKYEEVLKDPRAEELLNDLAISRIR